MNIENKAVNTIRMLSVDQIESANSGHPGLPLGAAPMAYALFKNHLVRDSKDLDWKNRDRFILSAGHGSALLYSLFYLFDYGLSLDDLKAKVIIGNGGVLDILSGRANRAPEIFIKLGLEWLYRLIKNPSRIKRQIDLPKFLLAVMRDKNSVE